jgi:hypothetical protein
MLRAFPLDVDDPLSVLLDKSIHSRIIALESTLHHICIICTVLPELIALAVFLICDQLWWRTVSFPKRSLLVKACATGSPTSTLDNGTWNTDAAVPSLDNDFAFLSIPTGSRCHQRTTWVHRLHTLIQSLDVSAALSLWPVGTTKEVKISFNLLSNRFKILLTHVLWLQHNLLRCRR